jgi:hypothetical protein
MPRRRSWPIAVLLVLALVACGGGGDDDAALDEPGTSTSAATDEADHGSGDDPTTEILGEETQLSVGATGAEDLRAEVDGRECVLEEALFGSCRASTGAGGAFLVTAEGNEADPSEWNVVVRCGLQPAVPVASARGRFTPVFTDLGSGDYGEMIGMTLLSEDEGDLSLIYLPDGADCPLVWGLGQTARTSILVGGVDALNGSEQPVRFTRPDGSVACVESDGDGGFATRTAADGDCTATGQ